MGLRLSFDAGLLKTLKPEQAVALAYLTERWEHAQANSELIMDGYFCCTMEKMQQQIHFNRHVQQRVLSSLQKLGYIETKRVGIPACRYIRINWRKLYTAPWTEVMRLKTVAEE